MYPYNCIGVLTAKFDKNDDPWIQTAFLIGETIILTAAHGCFKRTYNQMASEIYFYPSFTGDLMSSMLADKKIRIKEPFNIY